MRSIWKGHIRFSLVTIPIRVYNAIETSETVRFNQLHKDCNGQIGYDKKCKKCAQNVTGDDILKGYQYEPGNFVVLEQSDFEKVKLKSTKIIEIEGFVQASEVPQSWYESPYYAGPDGDVAAKTYSLLCAALKESNRVGIGRLVLRDREDVVILSPQDQGLVLYKLRYPNEIRKITDVPQIDGLPEADPAQLKLANNLVDSMSIPLQNLELKDRYQDALREMIQAKIEGQEIVHVEEEEAPVVDIMTALKQSIEQAKSSRKPMEEAKGESKAQVQAEEEKVGKTEKSKSKPKKKAG